MAKLILVVGMHRSATSLLAKGLHRNGCHMGDDLIGAGKGNPHGHFECRQVVALNNKILYSNGGTWYNPPDNLSCDESLTEELSGYVRTRSRGRPLWGAKDPRFCITWPVWVPLIKEQGHDLHVIAAWRSPQQIAESLKRRDGIEIEDGLELAKKYQRKTIELLESLYD